MPALCQPIGLIKLLISHGRIKNGFTARQCLKIQIVHHHTDKRPDTAAIDKRRKELGILLHLENGGYPASQQFGNGQSADDLALLLCDDTAHWKIQAVCWRMSDVFGPPAKHGIPYMVVCAHEAGHYDFSFAVDYGFRHRVLLTQYMRISHCRNAILFNIHCAVFNNAVSFVDRHDCGVGNQYRHCNGYCPLICAESDGIMCAGL